MIKLNNMQNVQGTDGYLEPLIACFVSSVEEDFPFEISMLRFRGRTPNCRRQLRAVAELASRWCLKWRAEDSLSHWLGHNWAHCLGLRVFRLISMFGLMVESLYHFPLHRNWFSWENRILTRVELALGSRHFPTHGVSLLFKLNYVCNLGYNCWRYASLGSQGPLKPYWVRYPSGLARISASTLRLGCAW